MNELLLSNIIPVENLRKVQINVLKNVSDAVMKTAGPYGSNTMIIRQKEFATYSKDGKKVLDNIKYYGPLEKSIVDDLSQLVSHVVKEVGDGTTSAIRMSYYIFKELLEKQNTEWDGIPTYEIIQTFKKVTKDIQETIRLHGRETTIEDIYKICMISTNGNTEISKSIADIYEKYGLNVYIDLGTSNTPDHILKEYDGITLEKGYSSNAYINNKEGHCVLRNPRIYYFKDPINTDELSALFQCIVSQNIMQPLSKNDWSSMVPTVILCPSISRDVESLLTEIETHMYSVPDLSRPPLLVISQLNRYVDELDDVCRLCGCKAIMKYIDPEIHKRDIEKGAAPSFDNILDWCGTAEIVDADSSKTKFINPAFMYRTDKNGERVESDIYKAMKTFLELELKSSIENNESIVTTGKLKRRLATLNANMVQYLIGGISASDREADKDLAEDAVLNCRSAVSSGVGYGACYEGLVASKEVDERVKSTALEIAIATVIYNAYMELEKELYSTAMNKSLVEDAINTSLEKGMPMNLRTKEYDGSVLSSINTDITILDAISRIVTIMFTANQGLTGEPLENKYANAKDL